MHPDRIPVAVFAYNERHRIERCLDSLYSGGLGRDLSIHVLCNGCSDGTEDVVRAYTSSHPEVTLHTIAFGDKANAWNYYISRVAPVSDIHVFVDGDNQVLPNALSELKRGLDENPRSHGAAAIPVSGRSVHAMEDWVVKDHTLHGCLYALRGDFVERIKARNLRLPIGLVGEDSWVGALAKFDLDPETGWDLERVVPCPNAKFRYDSMSILAIADIRHYLRRRVRYALRHWQNVMLQEHVKIHRLAWLPRHVDDVYRDYSSRCELHWRGLDTLFDWVALRQIRVKARNGRRG